AQSGRLDEIVAQVVPAESMTRLREILETASEPTANLDLRMAASDGVDQTPTLVFVYRGHREKVAPVGSFRILQRYIDQLPVE
ncbi:MAG: hypothetical protein ABJC09_03435, partial [Terriglobia bacterium]